MNILTIDFETYYDRDFSLSKMTTEEYIRSELFETIGVAVKVDDGETEWFSGTEKEIWKFLQKFDWANAVGLAHNAMFDMAILNWRYGISPKKIADTLSMARAIHGTEVGGSLGVLVQHTNWVKRERRLSMRWVKDELIFLMKTCPVTLAIASMMSILLIAFLGALLLTFLSAN